MKNTTFILILLFLALPALAQTHVTVDQSATRLHYETHFRPDFWVPALIGPAIMKNEITRQFERLAAEIMRRSNARSPANPTELVY